MFRSTNSKNAESVFNSQDFGVGYVIRSQNNQNLDFSFGNICFQNVSLFIFYFLIFFLILARISALFDCQLLFFQHIHDTNTMGL